MVQKRVSLFLLVIILVTTSYISILGNSIDVEPTDLTGIKVAVYEGVTNEQSSSQSSQTALLWMFRWMNATTDVVTAEEIRNGILDDYDIVAVPGGWAWAYYQDLQNSGVGKIRDFVANGGAYFGVCAGAYFACDSLIWEGRYIEYTLDLYPNQGIGPVEEIASWPDFNMTRITLNKGIEGIDLSGEPDSHMTMYYGGPYFETSGTQGVTIIATYNANDEPALIAYEYESGRIVLSGPHVEWEEDADRDGVTWVNEYDDEGTEWNMMLQIALWLSESALVPITTITSTTTTTTTTVTTTISITGISSTEPESPQEMDPAMRLVVIAVIAVILMTISIALKLRE